MLLGPELRRATGWMVGMRNTGPGHGFLNALVDHRELALDAGSSGWHCRTGYAYAACSGAADSLHLQPNPVDAHKPQSPCCGW